jgi:hypothetical protein
MEEGRAAIGCCAWRTAAAEHGGARRQWRRLFDWNMLKWESPGREGWVACGVLQFHIFSVVNWKNRRIDYYLRRLWVGHRKWCPIFVGPRIDAEYNAIFDGFLWPPNMTWNFHRPSFVPLKIKWTAENGPFPSVSAYIIIDMFKDHYALNWGDLSCQFGA